MCIYIYSYSLIIESCYIWMPSKNMNCRFDIRQLNRKVSGKIVGNLNYQSWREEVNTRRPEETCRGRLECAGEGMDYQMNSSPIAYIAFWFTCLCKYLAVFRLDVSSNAWENQVFVFDLVLERVQSSLC